MSEQFFAEATVKIGPDLTKFASDLSGKLKIEIEKVENRGPVVRIGPALTKDFIGKLNGLITEAVASVQRKNLNVRIGPALTKDFVGKLTGEVDAAVARVKPLPVRVGVEQVGTVGRTQAQAARDVAGRFGLNVGTDVNAQAEEALRKREQAAAKASQRQALAPVVQQKEIAKAAENAAIEVTKASNAIRKFGPAGAEADAALASLDASLKSIVGTENAAAAGAERLSTALAAGQRITPTTTAARDVGATQAARNAADVAKSTSAEKAFKAAKDASNAAEGKGVRAKTDSQRISAQANATERALAQTIKASGLARAEGNRELRLQSLQLRKVLRDRLADQTKDLAAARASETQAAKQTAAQKALTRATTQANEASRAGSRSTTAVGRTQAVIGQQASALKNLRQVARQAAEADDQGTRRTALTRAAALRGELALSDAQLKRAAVVDGLAAAQTRANLVDEAGVGATTAAAIAHAKAGAAEAAHADAAKVLAAALETEDAALIAQATALEFSTRAQAQAAVQDAESLRSTRRRSAQQSQVSKGALATSLSFVGLRGATLAASKSFLVGAAAIAIFQKAIGSTAKFEQQLNVFQATAGATAAQMQRVREAARALGADITLPAVSSADAAEAMTELSKAGLSVTDSIAGARGVLQLATAAAIDNAKAVELAASALNAFQLQGRDATHVADVFANAANQAQGSIEDIGAAFTQAAAAGRQAGLSFEDTSLFLTVLARNGLRGSDAGTSLRTALIRLIKPTDAARAQLNKLGISIRDAAGNIRPDIFLQITSALQGLPKAQKDATIALLGGQDAFRAISILGRGTIQDFIKLRRELRQNGTAADLAAARTKGLAGAGDALASTLETVGIQIGRNFAPSLNKMVRGLTTGIAQLSESSTVAGTLQSTFDALTLSAQALSTVLGTLAPILAGFASASLRVTNSIGVGPLLATIAAYKLLPGAVAKATASLNALKASYAALGVAQVAESSVVLPAGVRATEATVGKTTKLKGALSAAAGSFNIYAAAAAVAAGGLLFLATRESATERATRHLKEATDELIDSQEKLGEARRQAQDTRLGVNQARLDVVNAQEAVGPARDDVSKTTPGTFAHRKAQLALAVALDNVKAAEERLARAVHDANVQREIANQLAKNAKDARDKEVASLVELTAEEERKAKFLIRANPNAQAQVQSAAVQGVTKKIREQADTERKKATEESIATAKRLTLLANVSAALNKLPTEKAIEIAIHAPSAQAELNRLAKEFGASGKEMVAALQFAVTGEGTRELKKALKGLIDSVTFDQAPLVEQQGRFLGHKYGFGIAGGITDETPNIQQAVNNALGRSRGQLAGLERQNLQLDIAGAGLQAQLANAKQREATARQILAQDRKNHVAEETINKDLQALAGVVADRRAIEDEIAQNQKDANDKAKEAADKADQARLDKLERVRNRAQERLSDAQETETLADDISRTKALRRLIHQQINVIRETIKDRNTQAEAIRTLQASERDLGRSLKDLNKQRKQQIQDRIAESNQLDIDFAQTTHNRNLEIRARKREIARLQKLQALTKAGTVEYKRLRNAIAEQKAALHELTQEQKSLFAEMAFNFLTTQQGFAANLLGNLLPVGAIGNTVAGRLASGASGTSGTASAAAKAGVQLPNNRLLPQEHGRGSTVGSVGKDQAVAAAITSAAHAGPTRGQQSVQLTLLRQILQVLQAIRRGDDHPEHHRSRRNSNAALDTRK